MIQTISTFIKTRHERSISYYMRAFDTYEKTGKNTYNNAAAYFGCAWMLYRKMYLHAIVALICQYILFMSLSFIGLKITLFGEADTGQSIGVLLSVIISCRLFGTYGNALYYNVIKSRISEKYHTLNNYQPTAPALAICFAAAHCPRPTLLAVVLLALYYYRDDISLNRDQSSSKQLKDTKITPEEIKQYLEKTAQNSNKIPTYLAYLLTAISLVLIMFVGYYDPSWRIIYIICTLFPVIHA